MFVSFRKVVLASLIILTVLTTGAWQNIASVSAEKQSASQVETPLYPGLTWSSLGTSTQNIRINIQGDSISVSGERFAAQEQFLSSFPLPQDLVIYYSNGELAKSGWVSYDAFDGPDGVHYIFYHEDGLYLSVEFLKCQSNPEKTCVAIWKSVPVDPQATASIITNVPENLASTTTSTFSKTSPADGATGVNASSVTLRWGTYSAAQKYTYCVQESDCGVGSNWDSTYNTSVTLTTLSNNRTYHWQVRALTCGTCTPKTWVYANNGDNWIFQTQSNRVAIIGNAGVVGATLSYVDGTAKTVTSDSRGDYTITVPYNWSGTVTPSKSGYRFAPTSASFSNLTASQTIQNFIATAIYTISGNTGLAGVTLSYTDGTPQTVVSDASGNYSIVIPSGWNGTITPSYNICYTFTPVGRTYSSVTGNQTGQSYTAAFNSAPGCANVNVKIASSSMGNYGIPSGGRATPAYQGIFNGPVKISSTLPIFATERTLYGNSFHESTGIPNDQLTTDYWFPWYDFSIMQTWISVGNPSTTQNANVSVYIAGQCERTLYGQNFNETNGIPNNRLASEYWFPWYDFQIMQTWISVGNPSTSQTAHVSVYIAGQFKESYSIPPNGRWTPNYPNVFDGPVQVKSTAALETAGNPSNTPGIPIIATERTLYGPSFNETPGVRTADLTTDYWLPTYDSTTMQTWISVGNPSASQAANVSIYIAGQFVESHSVAAHGRWTPIYSGTLSGPLEVKSTAVLETAGNPSNTPGISILVSARTLRGSSFSETNGIPANQLDSVYWFTWYDFQLMQTSIHFGKP